MAKNTTEKQVIEQFSFVRGEEPNPYEIAEALERLGLVVSLTKETDDEIELSVKTKGDLR